MAEMLGPDQMIEEIAGDLMLSDPADKDALLGLILKLDALKAQLTDQDPSLLESLERCRALLENSAAANDEKERTAHSDKAAEQLAGLQRQLSQAAESQATASWSTGNLCVPEWVDEDTFNEFIANHPMVLDEIEEDMLAVEQGQEEAYSDLRRKIHTLKGEAGVLGLEDLETVCHVIEDALDTPENAARVIDRLLVVKDWMGEAFQAYAGHNLPARKAAEILAIFNGNQDIPPQTSCESVANDPPESEPNPAIDTGAWDEETVVVAGEFLQESEEGLAKVDELLLSIELDEPDGEITNAMFRVFHTIKGVAGFLELVDIANLAHAAESLLNKIREGSLEFDSGILDLLFDSTKRMQEMLHDLRTAMEHGGSFGSGPGTHAIIQQLNQAAGEGRDTAAEKQPAAARPTADAGPSEPIRENPANRPAKRQEKKLKEVVKVDLERVDNLVGLIGELVIVEAMIANAPEIAGMSSPDLRKHLSQMTKITRDVQDIGTRMRMVPVRSVFQKMARMVRDLSRKNGKSIAAVLQGEATEMDRSMVEQIADPLVHMIRNAVDHGIEDHDERLRLGKPGQGTIKLHAYHQGGSIVVEISDDGRGLDRDAILAKAVEKGLVADGDQLTDKEIYNLVFAPGFSTAKVVTEISGRGVGMDVVRRNIEAMLGKVNIDSVPGRGTVFKMVLPLTLAIIDGMLVTCGGERYIIPTLAIVESLRPERNMVFSLAGQGELVRLRGEINPLFRLDRLLKIPGAIQDPVDALVVIVESSGRKIGILVDDVLAQQQVVIKGLGTGMPNTNYLSGAAILSDGRVGLILNPDGIIGLVNENTFQNRDISESPDNSVMATAIEAVLTPTIDESKDDGGESLPASRHQEVTR